MSERRAKYNAMRTMFEGQWFDSKAEARRYQELQLLRLAGKIEHIEIHPRFKLFPPAEVNGERLRAVQYIADFMYRDLETNKIIVEDVKGVQTPVFRLKANIFRRRYPKYELRIVEA